MTWLLSYEPGWLWTWLGLEKEGVSPSQGLLLAEVCPLGMPEQQLEAHWFSLLALLQ